MKKWFENRGKNRKRTLRLENLEDRMLLAVTAGGDSAADAVLIAEAQPTGNIIQVTELTRTAINTAITNAADGDTIQFASSLSGQTFTATASYLKISGKNLTLDGNGVIVSGSSTLTRAGFVVSDCAVTFKNFTFNSLGACAIQGSNADITAVDCVFTNNRSNFNVQVEASMVYIGGGGIGVLNGSITVEGSSFTNNYGALGGALAVCNLDGTGTITVTDSTFDGNYCNKSDYDARGGAIAARNANIIVSDSTFTGNIVTAGTKVQGGALYAEGEIIVDNSTFMWNDADTFGTKGSGGAIFVNGSTLTISNSVIANNRAHGAGGGIYASTVNMYNCTVASNVSAYPTGGNITASAGNIYNSILANARTNITGSASSYDMNTNLSRSSLHNTYVTSDNFSNSEVDFISLPAYSGELGEFRYANFDNAYWKTVTWDYNLGANSTARNTGDDEYALTTDKKVIPSDLAGNDRFVYTVDMGAYERQMIPGELAMPENVTADASYDSILLSWDAVEGTSGYTIRWQTEGSSSIEEVSVGSEETSYTITGLKNRRVYSISIKADGDGESTFDSAYARVSAKTKSREVALVVTNLNDSGDGSLRSLLSKLDDTSSYTITFADGLSGTLELQSTLILANGNLVSIDASGITFTAADGAQSFSAFYMVSNDYDGGFSLSNAVVTGFGDFGFGFSGNMTANLISCSISNTQCAVHAENGVKLTISASTIEHNASKSYQGTGVYADNCDVTLTQTTVSGNSSYSRGGGVYLVGGTAVIKDTVITQNTLEGEGNGNGAGLFAADAVVWIESTSITENLTTTNSAGGGGIYIDGNTDLKVLNSLIAGNKVARANGSVDGNGGGLYVYNGTAVLSNTQIIGNWTTGYAGASIVLFGQLTMYNCTVAGNVSNAGVGGILVADSLGGSIGGVYNSIVSGNTNKSSSFGDDNFALFSSQPYTIVNWTLLGSKLTAGSGSVVKSGVSLANQVVSFSAPSYASMSQTAYKAWDFTPVSSAVIVNAGSNGNALDPNGDDLTTDYRGNGYVRIYDSTVDVGAYEYQKVLPPIEGITVTGYTGDYDGEAHGVTVSGTKSGDTVFYSNDGSSWTTTPITYSEVGSYTVQVKVSRSGYQDWNGSAVITIKEVYNTKLSVVVVLSDSAATVTESAEIPSSITTAKVGDTVYAQVWIKNVDGSDLGCTGGYIDLAYSDAVFTVGSFIASSIYDVQASMYDTKTAGRIVDFGGCAETGVNDLAVSEWALLGTFTFTASAEGTAVVSAEAPTYQGVPLSSLNLSRAGQGNIKTAEIEFNSASLTVSQGGSEKLNAPSISTGKKGFQVSYGANRHTIVWGAVAHASGYELAYSTDGLSWKTMTVDTASAVVTGLTYGTDVTYKVKALGTGSYTDSDYSQAKTFNVCPMDINNDGDIAGADRSMLSSAWLTSEGDEEFLYCCDINADGDVAGADRNFLSSNWLCEAGDEDLIYPKAKKAETDAFFADYVSSDIAADFDVF